MIEGILISCVNRPPGYSIAKKMKAWERGLKVCGATIVQPNWLIRRSRFFDAIEFLPLPLLNGVADQNAEEKIYLYRLLHIMDMHGLNAFLPTNDEEIYLASKHKDYLTSLDILVFVNDWDVTAIAQNKFKLNMRAHEVGFPAPNAFRTNALSDTSCVAMKLPMIVKAERSTSSAGVRKVNSKCELTAAIQDLSCIYEGIYLEEYISGNTEVSINLVRSPSGIFRCCFGLEKHHYVHSSWSTTVRIIELDEVVVSAAKRLVESVGVVGFVAIQTKVESTTGELKLVELNPRLGNNARILVRMIPELGTIFLEESDRKIPVPYGTYGVSLFDDWLTFPLYIYHRVTHHPSIDNESPAIFTMLKSYIDIYVQRPFLDDLTVALFNDTLFFLGFTIHIMQLERLPRDWKRLLPWGAVSR